MVESADGAGNGQVASRKVLVRRRDALGRFVEQHQLQWHCRQLCDTGIGMLGLANLKMHHAQQT